LLKYWVTFGKRVVGVAKRGRVDDRVQVAHLRPRARDALVRVVERLDEGLPRGRGIELPEPVDHRLALANERFHRGNDVLGTNAREARQAGKIEKGIRHGLSRCGRNGLRR
jgi:hypothetical protein